VKEEGSLNEKWVKSGNTTLTIPFNFGYTPRQALLPQRFGEVKGIYLCLAHSENSQILRNKDNRHLVKVLYLGVFTVLVILVQTISIFPTIREYFLPTIPLP